MNILHYLADIDNILQIIGLLFDMSTSNDALPNNGHNTVIKEKENMANGEASSAVNTKAIPTKKQARKRSRSTINKSMP